MTLDYLAYETQDEISDDATAYVAWCFRVPARSNGESVIRRFHLELFKRAIDRVTCPDCGERHYMDDQESAFRRLGH